ncbi:MAG: D-alanine--D-alanine ligase family protein [Bacillota bacterium]
MKKKKVALIFGGKTPEHEVSVLSAKSVIQNIDKEKYNVIPVGVSKNGIWQTPEYTKEIIDKDLEIVENEVSETNIAESLISFLNKEVDVVFPLIHGPYGEDGKLQGFFDLIDIPYVGTGVLSSAVGMDKAFMKKIFSYHNINQGNFIILTEEKYNFLSIKEIINRICQNIYFPCFIKPANMGSSIGITRVDKPIELNQAFERAFQFDDKIIIEEYIEGREIECSVLGNNKIQVSLPGEIISKNKYYDYEAKYKDEKTELKIPASLNNHTINRIQNMAEEVFKAIEGKGFARVDFFLTESEKNKIYVNEINTIPGFTRYSMYPKLWEESGLSYPDLIDRLIKLSFEK